MPAEVGGYLWSQDNQAELANGWIMKGDTLADIAAAIEVSPEHLQQTIDRCNEECAAGTDDFGRSPDKKQPIGSGPYYAIELAPSIIYTIHR